MSSVLRDSRTVGELLSDIANDTSTLVRQEIELAKTEMKEKATHAAKQSGTAFAGAVIAYVGLLTLVAATVIGLGHLIGYGWSALVIGAILTIAGAVVAMGAVKKLKSEGLAPEQTTESIKETKAWAKDQIRR